MAIRHIRLEGDEILRKVSKPVKEINEKILTLLDDMKETMEKANGVGLAAPQVGSLRRVVVIDTGEEILELVNPQIVERIGVQNLLEGCLSIPGKMGRVERPENVKVKYLDRSGEEKETSGEGVLAIAFCHEIDHLDGVLYVDKATDIEDTEPEEEETKAAGEAGE